MEPTKDNLRKSILEILVKAGVSSPESPTDVIMSLFTGVVEHQSKEQPTGETVKNESQENITSFIEYEKSCKKELRGGFIMYDVVNYKWLSLSELYNYWKETISLPPTHSAKSGEDVDVNKLALEIYPKIADVNKISMTRNEALELQRRGFIKGYNYPRAKSGLNKEEIIKWIDGEIKTHKESLLWKNADGDPAGLVIDTLEEVKQHILSLPSPPPAQREEGEAVEWISVKDELPKENVRVLVCLTYGGGKEEIKTSYYSSRTECFDDFMHELITHWMPIPNSPNSNLNRNN